MWNFRIERQYALNEVHNALYMSMYFSFNLLNLI